ncbi:lactose/cellobiose PTS transporter subunit IIB, partial [Enterococcus faecalis]|uniref:lactose/cellobiose PTS transporter subunit IIB n=2 Tax=Enterococcus TaxID=1350 RepID=UPI004041DB0B
KAYDRVLVAQEAERVEEIDELEEVVPALSPANAASIIDQDETVLVESDSSASVTTTEKELKVLVLCAGAGTSAMLANALEEGAKETGEHVIAKAGAYGSHYDIMPKFDLVVLAPQVNSYYDDIKKDTDKLGIKLIATKGAEYIKLTRNPTGAIKFVMDQVG